MNEPDAAPESPIDGNVASRLTMVAKLMGGAIAIAQPTGRPVRPGGGTRPYRLTTFKQLDDRSTHIARGLIALGVRPGDRMVSLVPFSDGFISLVFGLLKTGAEIVLIDPGIDRRHLLRCLSEANPDGFVGIPRAMAVRWWFHRRFPSAVKNVTAGVPTWAERLWPGPSLASTERKGRQVSDVPLPRRERDDPAAIIFTTGSTGPPKGVAYTHGTFHAQIDRIRERYDIHRGSRDLACFPLFGLFDAVMGVTTVIPDMDPTRPADVNPENLIHAADQWECDQAFGSPALWKTVVHWADQHVVAGRPLGSVRRLLSAGAPVPAATLQKLRTIVHEDAEIHTPYGATEALPVASIESREIIAQTGPAAAKGKGVCVGTRFEGVRWKVIEISDGPIATLADAPEVPRGGIGELMVSGPMVTTRYKVRADQNAMHKVADGDAVWHRMGDLGYLDDRDRFWFCGRKAHRVTGGNRTWFTLPCEAVFAAHPRVNRSALIGWGKPGSQTPVMVVEPVDSPEKNLRDELRDLARRNPLTLRIEHFVVWPRPLPVDIRHNSKIFRERIAAELNERPERFGLCRRPGGN